MFVLVGGEGEYGSSLYGRKTYTRRLVAWKSFDLALLDYARASRLITRSMKRPIVFGLFESFVWLASVVVTVSGCLPMPGAKVAPPGTVPMKECGPDGVIDDFEDNNNQISVIGDRGGYWYTYADTKVPRCLRFPEIKAACSPPSRAATIPSSRSR